MSPEAYYEYCKNQVTLAEQDYNRHATWCDECTSTIPVCGQGRNYMILLKRGRDNLKILESGK